MNAVDNTLKVEELLYTTEFPEEYVNDYKFSLGCKKKLSGEQHRHSPECERIHEMILKDLPQCEDDIASALADAMSGIIRYNHGKGTWEALHDDWEPIPSDFSLHNLLRRYAKLYKSAWDFYGARFRKEMEQAESIDEELAKSGKKAGIVRQMLESQFYDIKRVEKMIERVGQERGFASIITLVKGHEKVRATTDTDIKLSNNMFRKPSQVSDLTTRSSLVKQMVPGYGIGQIFGQSQAGKSFIAHDLARHIAAGAPEWMGIETSSKEAYERAGVGVPRDVLYIVGESPDQFRLMEEGWRANNPEWVDASENHFYTYINGDEYVDEDGNTQFTPEFSLNPRSEETATVKSMRKWIKESGIKPAMIVMDTQAALTGGVDENNAMAMEELVLGPLRKWANEEKVMIFLVHHAGKGQDATYRGSSAQFAAMDVVWEVKAKGDMREVTVKKLKSDGGFGPKDAPTYQILNDEKTGLPYIQYVGAIGAKMAQYKEKLGVAQSRKQHIVELVSKNQDSVSTNGLWIKEQFKAGSAVVPEELQAGKNAIDKALKELVEQQLLEKVGTGKDIRYVATA